MRKYYLTLITSNLSQKASTSQATGGFLSKKTPGKLPEGGREPGEIACTLVPFNVTAARGGVRGGEGQFTCNAPKTRQNQPLDHSAQRGNETSPGGVGLPKLPQTHPITSVHQPLDNLA